MAARIVIAVMSAGLYRRVFRLVISASGGHDGERAPQVAQQIEGLYIPLNIWTQRNPGVPELHRFDVQKLQIAPPLNGRVEHARATRRA